MYQFLEAPLEDFCSLWDKDFAVYNTAEILDGQIYGLGVAGELKQTFNDLMKEKNVLCIDDSNTILRDIIDGSDAPFVYEKLGVRFDHFLLDEFQDTSDVQWTNFSPLLHNSDSQGGENLIALVGRQGSRVSMRVARGSASLLSSHGRGTWPRDLLQHVSRPDSPTAVSRHIAY